ncbi:MAG TPA: M1 family aminopeptidase [Bacteroidota bacterium]|nr:M1 family aminopeptidase [Bacteroidota bacterium]
MTYYKLDLKLSITPAMLRGSVMMTARCLTNGLTSITIDLMDAMTADSVFVGGLKVKASQQPSLLNIPLDRAYSSGETFTVVTYYHGLPVSTGFGSFNFSSTATGSPWIWSLSEPYGARDWWPCKDHPGDKADSLDVWVTCDSSLKVGSEGILASVTDNADGTRTHHWKHRYPIATYLVSIAVAPYTQLSGWFKYSPTDSMLVLLYALDATGAAASLNRTITNLQIYSDLYGLYPFIKEKLGNAQFGWGGGMEHQTMISLVNFSEDLIAHEMAHQWFGDMITLQSWPDLWLNEGFAVYSVGLYHERLSGSAGYWSILNRELSNAKNAVGSIHVQDTANVSNLFNGTRVYSKGASTLHMLRHVLGDSLFFKAILRYASDPRLRYGTASTEDLRADCEAASGRSLGWFFNEWIYGENYPRYQYEWGSAKNGSTYSVRVSLRQSTGTSNPAFFQMPIDFEFTGAGFDTTITAMNDAQNQVFVFTLSHQPTSFILDPNNWILKDAAGTLVNVAQITETPSRFDLLQNYPNPFNPTTAISYQLPAISNVTLKVFDVLGREISTLVNAEQRSGNYRVTFDASKIPSGIYIYRLNARPISGSSHSEYVETRKMVLTK